MHNLRQDNLSMSLETEIHFRQFLVIFPLADIQQQQQTHSHTST